MNGNRIRGVVVAALVALIVSALGAGGIAQATGLLDGKTIKNHTVGFSKLTPAAVKLLRGGKSKAGAAAGVDGFDGIDGQNGSPGTAGPMGTPGAAGARGLPGGTGDPGAPGAPGDPGAPGAPGAGLVPSRVAGAPSPALPATAGGSVTSVATCAAGQHVLGGGYNIATWQVGVTVTESDPSADGVTPATWTVKLVNGAALANTSVVTAFAVCA